MNRLVWLVTAIYASVIVLTTAHNAPDFEVYWKAARTFLDGGPVYSVMRDGLMTFKYPPWILPVFVPFAFLPLAIAKVVWGLVEAASLAYIVFWLIDRVSPKALILALIAFSGIWTVHAFDGQISLPLTALALAGFASFERGERSWKSFVQAYALSAKIFTLFPLLGWKHARKDGARVASLALGCAVLSVLALMSHHWSLADLARSYREATAAGLDASGGPVVSVAGAQAQGFVSMLFRLARLDPRNTGLVLVFAFVIAVALAFLWKRLSVKLEPSRTWAGWVALTATVQPLAGFHSFVFAFPFAVLAFSDAAAAAQLEEPRARRMGRARLALSITGTLMIAAITSKTLGSVGEGMQLLSVKSWGVLVCALSIAEY